MEEFKQFIARGNVMDMAVGVIIITALRSTAGATRVCVL